jgi:hypothetical protein
VRGSRRGLVDHPRKAGVAAVVAETSVHGPSVAP